MNTMCIVHKQYKYNYNFSISKSQAICQYINRFELVWNKLILNIYFFLLAYQFKTPEKWNIAYLKNIMPVCS